MNRQKSNNSNEQSTKRIKFSGQNNAMMAQVEQTADIFKLPVEILEYVFDYLSLEDLNAVSKTCKWIQTIAVQCYQQNYSGLRPSYHKYGQVTVRHFNGDGGLSMDKSFFKIFDKLQAYEIYNDKIEDFCNDPLCKELNQLKKLDIGQMGFKANGCRDVKPYTIRSEGMLRLLSRIEDLRLHDSRMPAYYLDYLISLTPNIKKLRLNSSALRKEYPQTDYSNFLNSKYPLLKHLEVTTGCRIQPLIVQFLENNPNIDSFATNWKHLYEYRESMMNSKIKLDVLTIQYELSYFKRRISSFHADLQRFCSTLSELYYRCFYNRLKLCICHSDFVIDQAAIDGISQLSSLDGLKFELDLRPSNRYQEPFQLAKMKNLEEIGIPDSKLIVDLKTFATCSINLQRIHFGRSTLDNLMVLTSQSSKLNRIRIDWFMKSNGNFELHQIIRLSAMNTSRAKLANANKVTIYVKEDVYLATKRAERDTDLEFIRLKRIDSYEWTNEFNFITEYRKERTRYQTFKWENDGQREKIANSNFCVFND